LKDAHEYPGIQLVVTETAGRATYGTGTGF
jgi:hypothetical protein